MMNWIDQCIVVCFAVAFFAVLAWMAAFRPVVAIAFSFILFTFAWHTVATAYIDLAGPVYSSQLLRNIGPGSATVPQVIAYLVTIAPFFFFLSSERISRWTPALQVSVSTYNWITLANIVFIGSAIFVFLLYVDMARRGVIPFFAKMERFDYTNAYAGPFHRFLIRYGNLVAGIWGATFAATRLRENKADLRFVGVLALTFVYLFLAGNRFSSFYSFGAFFIAPYAAVIAVNTATRSIRRPFDWLTTILAWREMKALLAALTVVLFLVAAGLYNNLVNVRAGDPVAPGLRFLERTFIQPSEIGWVSYERTFLFDVWRPDRVTDALFLSPIDPSRNTSIQYLMHETIGEPRTSLHLSAGFQFAGGFPEIFFELFGPYLAWLCILGAGWVVAALIAIFLRGLVEGHYATVFWSAYVLYGFQVMYIGGMLNFVLPWSYWLKITFLVASIALERSLGRFGIFLLPWFIFEVPNRVALFTRKLLCRAERHSA